MSFQPPPPPPPPGGAPPPPPPGGQYGPPPGGGYPAPGGGFGGPAKVDPKTVNPLDWGIIGAGVVAFIFSLFSYYTVDVNFGGLAQASDSSSAWSGGFFGWAGTLLALAGAAAVAMLIFAPQVKLPLSNRLAGLIAFGVALLFTFLALFVGGYDDQGVKGVDTGHGIGYWVSLIAILAGTVLSLMRLQASGEKLPGALGNMPNIGHYGPQGGPGSGPTGQPGYGTPPPPPPPGSAPPPPPPGGYGPPR